MAPEEQTTPSNVTPDPILQLAMGHMASKHLFVANEIGLFQHLAAGPATLDALAQRTGVPRRTVRISTDAMVALGLVERLGYQYENGPVAAAYLSGHGPLTCGPCCATSTASATRRGGNSKKYPDTGQAPNRQGGGFSEADQRIFSEGVEAFTAGPAGALATSYAFSTHHQVLDPGGGTGSFLLRVLRQYAELQGTLLSWRALPRWRASV
jgi:hypothetical protein